MTQMYEIMDYKDKNIYSLDEMIDMYDNDKLKWFIEYLKNKHIDVKTIIKQVKCTKTVIERR